MSLKDDTLNASPSGVSAIRSNNTLGVVKSKDSPDEPVLVEEGFSLIVSPDNPHHPIHWSIGLKIFISVVYCLLQVFVTLTSTSYLSVEWIVEERFNVGAQVATLGQSLFIIGTAVGPAVLGPMSDLGGRKWIYVVSMVFYILCSIGCALPRNMAQLAIFMLLLGISGSCALSNVAGTIGDLFGDADAASQPMALFVMSANIGPSLGSPVGEWIGDKENMGFAWIYWLNCIIGGAFAIGLCFIPETLPRLVIAKAAAKEAKAKGEETPSDIMDSSFSDVMHEMRFVCMMALRILFTEPLVMFLGLFNGFTYGLLFLYLDGVFDVFVYNNGLSYIVADLTFLNFIVGVLIMFSLVPIQTYLYKRDRLRNGGIPRPEARFLISLVSVWGFPISLLWFGFTSDGNTSYWSPIIAGTLLGIVDPLLWLNMLSYIVDAYAPAGLSGSAIAAFSIPSFAIAGALSHAGVAMFERMSTKWAVATLGFISFGVVALVYVFYFFGAKIRGASKLCRAGVHYVEGPVEEYVEQQDQQEEQKE
ncbi:unnamed protein product [Kuraishia capsulata CBS 1993]|uniref:Major facilitator superfamily (MFS) profile domain-containing protein n=1 Tax=Kuraishia capsulata CBS 1993 TaxID=1382522 RepID=W6MGX1_9ASCO|nr:uncharacterized protein KUCA_T00000835001 [Kuraishia capsulata CBS 1993]CDK24868.1 unnamed protein product [Kuraishia capsulata CBS 1993]